MPIDYTKFNNIEDSDEEVEKKAVIRKTADEMEGEKNKAKKCANCGKQEGKLRSCTACKKVAYCSAECQRSDWKFHRRTCGSSSSSAQKAAKPKPPRRKTPAVSGSDDESENDDDDDDVGEWYRHRDTKLPPSSSAPEKLVDAGRQPEAETASSSGTQASVWNKAGTWEDRDVMGWVKDQLLPMCRGIERDFPRGLITVTEAECEGDASVGVVREKKRRILDLKIDLKLKAQIGTNAYTVKCVIHELTHDSQTDTIDVSITLPDKADAKPDLAASLRLELLATPTLAVAHIPPDAPHDTSFAHALVHKLRTDFLPAFLNL